MATKLKEVDAVVVGLGWTGGILSKELTEAGMKVVALERGAARSTDKDFAVPNIRDELRYVVRHDLMQNTARDTLTIRNNPSQEALPMRRLGSFLPGEVVGGSAVHWSGHTWRWTDMEFKIRSMYEERYGKKYIPDDMTIQDWGITYAELEPYYEKFEYTAAVSGKAGNIRGQIQPGGNPFEAPRARDYALPPLTPILASEMFTEAAKNNGYHPFPRPSANASRAYTNPDGSKYGACQYCGYCQRFGCEANAKGSPHMTVIPIAMRNPNFELRTNAWVTKVLKDSTGKRVTGVLYTNVLNGEEFEQPASHGAADRVRDQQRAPDAAVGHRPALRSGRAERRHRQELLLSDRRQRDAVLRGPAFQPVHERGRLERDDGRLQHQLGLRPRQARFRRRLQRRRRFQHRAADRLPAGAARHAAMGQGMEGGDREVVPDRDEHQRERQRDVEPLQLLRSRSDLPQCVRPAADAHDLRLQGRTSTRWGGTRRQSSTTIAKSMNPTTMNPAVARTDPWTVVPYQSTHNTGGTIMGTNPGNSALNKYLQSWDCHNLFVVGANVFPHNASYNPTGPVGALAYWTADAIKNRYVKNPGPLVSA